MDQGPVSFTQTNVAVILALQMGHLEFIKIIYTKHVRMIIDRPLILHPIYRITLLISWVEFNAPNLMQT